MSAAKKYRKTTPRLTLGPLTINKNTVMMGMIPAATLKHSVTPFADAAVLIWGHGAEYWVSAGVAIAAFGALNGYILIQGQLPYAIAKDHADYFIGMGLTAELVAEKYGVTREQQDEFSFNSHQKAYVD